MEAIMAVTKGRNAPHRAMDGESTGRERQGKGNDRGQPIRHG